MLAYALLPYPRGFHSEAGDSGWVTPVSFQARAVMLSGPGSTSTVSDHVHHAHRPGAGCSSAWRHLAPPSKDTSTRPMLWPSPASAQPRMVSGPAATWSPSVGTRTSQLSGRLENEMPSPAATVSASAS